mgnify:CR=1 FL=1
MKGKGSPTFSRNINDFVENQRTRSMLWHWDGKAEELRMVKVILYLSDVLDDAHGCMAVLRHNATGATAKFYGPSSVSVSPDGATVYVADTWNCLLYK